MGAATDLTMTPSKAQLGCRPRLLLLAAFAVASLLGLTGACSGKTVGVGGPDGADTDSTDDISIDGGGGALSCTSAGASCKENEECCSGSCDEKSGVCGSSIQACGRSGDECTASLDCCGLSCLVGRCADACTSDGDSCKDDGECCGGSCADGSCTPLNLSCKTAGNTCTDNGDCCSTLCADGICALGASYCVQKGDVCRSGSDCCTGVCNSADGASVGICGDAPAGPSNCSAGAAGTVCSACNECCSRLCAPYGPSGVSICQPASGCHLTGELCRRDADCCGGDPTSDLPGAGNVTCTIEPGAELGICRNAKSCSPQGNACHFKDYTCSVSAAANKCCSGVGNSGECDLDDFGIPRCNGLGADCRAKGQDCASSSDCCDGRPCVADAAGHLECADPPGGCVAAEGSCTVNADCCDGTRCVVLVGSTSGKCSTSTTSTCAEYGQACDSQGDCCGTTPCSDGRCVNDIVK